MFTNFVIRKSKPPATQRKRIYRLSRRFAHLRIATVYTELVLESIQIESVNTIPTIYTQ